MIAALSLSKEPPDSAPSPLPREAAREQRLDGLLAVRVEGAGARAGEVGVRDRRHAASLPGRSRPAEPGVLVLVEDRERLIAQLRELGAPPRPAAHRPVVQDRADDVDLLAAVDLVPERLEDLPERRAVAVAAVHQLRDVLEAH